MGHQNISYELVSEFLKNVMLTVERKITDGVWFKPFKSIQSKISKDMIRYSHCDVNF